MALLMHVTIRLQVSETTRLSIGEQAQRRLGRATLHITGNHSPVCTCFNKATLDAVCHDRAVRQADHGLSYVTVKLSDFQLSQVRTNRHVGHIHLYAPLHYTYYHISYMLNMPIRCSLGFYRLFCCTNWNT